MPAPIVRITQAVVDYLNAGLGLLTPTFTAQRKWLIPLSLADNDGELRVYVAPRPTIAHEARSRGSDHDNVTVLVAVMQRVDPDDLTAVDALVELVSDIKHALTTPPIAEGTWAGVEANPAFDREKLNARQFTAVVTVDFRIPVNRE